MRSDSSFRLPFVCRGLFRDPLLFELQLVYMLQRIHPWIRRYRARSLSSAERMVQCRGDLVRTVRRCQEIFGLTLMWALSSFFLTVVQDPRAVRRDSSQLNVLAPSRRIPRESRWAHRPSQPRLGLRQYADRRYLVSGSYGDVRSPSFSERNSGVWRRLSSEPVNDNGTLYGIN